MQQDLPRALLRRDPPAHGRLPPGVRPRRRRRVERVRLPRGLPPAGGGAAVDAGHRRQLELCAHPPSDETDAHPTNRTRCGCLPWPATDGLLHVELPVGPGNGLRLACVDHVHLCHCLHAGRSDVLRWWHGPAFLVGRCDERQARGRVIGAPLRLDVEGLADVVHEHIRRPRLAGGAATVHVHLAHLRSSLQCLRGFRALRRAQRALRGLRGARLQDQGQGHLHQLRARGAGRLPEGHAGALHGGGRQRPLLARLRGAEGLPDGREGHGVHGGTPA
mmetsp:Transcript_104514/g.337074  ORF Transcript_104514/g.337074 Transcript_104514/m.337074 type:complete len:276 (-) Transcript_104514:273-1100(-)